MSRGPCWLSANLFGLVLKNCNFLEILHASLNDFIHLYRFAELNTMIGVATICHNALDKFCEWTSYKILWVNQPQKAEKGKLAKQKFSFWYHGCRERKAIWIVNLKIHRYQCGYEAFMDISMQSDYIFDIITLCLCFSYVDIGKVVYWDQLCVCTVHMEIVVGDCV